MRVGRRRGWWSCSGYSPSGAATLSRTLSRRGGVPSTTATVVPLGCRGRDLQPAPDTFRPLCHDRKTVAAVRRAGQRCPDRHRTLRSARTAGRSRSVTHRFAAPGVLAGVGDRLLRDPQQFRLDRGGQPGGRLVEREVHPQARRRRRRCGRTRRSPRPARRAGRPRCAARTGYSRSSVITRVTSPRSVRSSSAGLLGVVGQGGQRVVDAVADHDQLLRDAVVDLAGQPLPLLVGGQRPDLVEEQRRLQPQRGRAGERRSTRATTRGG